MEPRRPYSQFDFLGGRAAARRIRRIRRLVAVGLLSVIVVGFGLRAGFSWYGTSRIDADTRDIRVQDTQIKNQIAAKLQSGATEEQMLADLQTREALITAALGSDAAAASFLARLAPLSDAQSTVVDVTLTVAAPKETSAKDAGTNAPTAKVEVSVAARLPSQQAVSAWIAELEQSFPEVAWGFPKWDDAANGGEITVTLTGPITNVDPARRNQLTATLQAPGGAS